MEKIAVWTWVLIACLVVALIGCIYLSIYYAKQKKSKSNKELFDVNKIVTALGGVENILSTKLDNKRLKITLFEPKLVSQETLKSMNISGFMTGKEIKLLVKENPKVLKDSLDQIRNGVNS